MGTILVLILACIVVWYILRKRKNEKVASQKEAQDKERQQIELQHKQEIQASLATLGEPTYKYEDGDMRVAIYDDKKLLVIDERQIPYASITGLEVTIFHHTFSEPDKVTTTNGKGLGSTIGRAAVGAAVGGVVGGVIGAATAKGKTTSVIEKGKSISWDEYAVYMKVANAKDGFFETKDAELVNKVAELVKKITEKDAKVKEFND